MRRRKPESRKRAPEVAVEPRPLRPRTRRLRPAAVLASLACHAAIVAVVGTMHFSAHRLPAPEPDRAVYVEFVEEQPLVELAAAMPDPEEVPAVAAEAALAPDAPPEPLAELRASEPMAPVGGARAFATPPSPARPEPVPPAESAAPLAQPAADSSAQALKQAEPPAQPARAAASASEALRPSGPETAPLRPTGPEAADVPPAAQAPREVASLSPALAELSSAASEPALAPPVPAAPVESSSFQPLISPAAALPLSPAVPVVPTQPAGPAPLASAAEIRPADPPFAIAAAPAAPVPAIPALEAVPGPAPAPAAPVASVGQPGPAAAAPPAELAAVAPAEAAPAAVARTERALAASPAIPPEPVPPGPGGGPGVRAVGGAGALQPSAPPPQALAALPAMPSLVIRSADPQAEIEKTLARFSCARLDADLGPGGAVRVSGHLASENDRSRLRQQLAEIGGIETVETGAVHIVGEPHCNVLATLGGPGFAQSNHQRYESAAFATPARFGVERYFGGQTLQLRLGTPQFESFVQVAYFSGDGRVHHLLPASDPLEARFPENAMIDLRGLDRAGRSMTIGPPYGLDMIVVVASSRPLFEGPRPAVEPAGDYLQALAAAVLRLRAADPDLQLEYAYHLIYTSP
ncbi:hypothetical protein ACUN0C_15875 [Faunimonas sp. B44]|uniref:hypothetical protein n=1 Tax=Faunimonas sp. B44 TaxID=3461493 RepID=UPI004044EC78